MRRILFAVTKRFPQSGPVVVPDDGFSARSALQVRFFQESLNDIGIDGRPSIEREEIAAAAWQRAHAFVESLKTQ